MIYTSKPLQTNYKPGQNYWDEAVYVVVSKAAPLAFEIASMFGRGYVHNEKEKELPRGAVLCVQPLIQTLDHYNHWPVHWNH